MVIYGNILLMVNKMVNILMVNINGNILLVIY